MESSVILKRARIMSRSMYLLGYSPDRRQVWSLPFSNQLDANADFRSTITWPAEFLGSLERRSGWFRAQLRMYTTISVSYAVLEVGHS